MSITDELRKYARGYELYVNHQLLDIADRIDAEHERGMADAELAAAPTETQLEELGYIELPKDMNGVPIRIGDRLRHENGCFIVTEMTIGQSGAWRAWDGENGYTVLLRNATHVQPDSWERIIEDAMEAYQFDDGSSEPSIGSLVERCKRLAGE